MTLHHMMLNLTQIMTIHQGKTSEIEAKTDSKVLISIIRENILKSQNLKNISKGIQ